MAARSTTQAASDIVTVTLALNRETKNTYRFDDPAEDSVLPSLYVKKSAFPKGAPESVTVTVA